MEEQRIDCERCGDTLSPDELTYGEDVCFPCMKHEDE